MRGKLRIWAVCRDCQFNSYDSKTAKKAVTTINLQNAGVLETHDKQGILLFTNVPSLEILTCPGRKTEVREDCCRRLV